MKCPNINGNPGRKTRTQKQVAIILFSIVLIIQKNLKQLVTTFQHIEGFKSTLTNTKY